MHSRFEVVHHVSPHLTLNATFLSSENVVRVAECCREDLTTSAALLAFSVICMVLRSLFLRKRVSMLKKIA
jgi:hypothetical protein